MKGRNQTPAPTQQQPKISTADVDRLHEIAMALDAFCLLLGESSDSENDKLGLLIEGHVRDLVGISARISETRRRKALSDA